MLFERSALDVDGREHGIQQLASLVALVLLDDTGHRAAGIHRDLGRPVDDLLVFFGEQYHSGDLVSNNGDLLVEAAIAGAGIALQPTFISGAVIKAGSMQVILPGHEPEPMSLYAVYVHRQLPASKVRCFVHFMEGYFGDPPTGTALNSGKGADTPNFECSRGRFLQAFGGGSVLPPPVCRHGGQGVAGSRPVSVVLPVASGGPQASPISRSSDTRFSA